MVTRNARNGQSFSSYRTLDKVYASYGSSGKSVANLIASDIF
jgi:hypothetical protein